MPFFSIIVPVYKVEKYLKQCVESVLAQSYANYELILVDDGSPDQCPEICDEFALMDQRVRVIHKENGGASTARNVGLDVAIGEYILFLDSDDFWDDEAALSKIFQALNKKAIDILIIGKKKYYPQDGIINNVCVPKWDKTGCPASYREKIAYLMKNNIFVAAAWDKVVRKELIDAGKLRFVAGQVGEDIEWCINLLKCNPSIDLLDMSFYVYRQQNDSSVSSNIKRKNLVDIGNIIKNYVPDKMDMSDCAIYLRNFLAVEYVLLLAITMRVSSHQIKDLLCDMREFWYLLDYNWYPYVKKVSCVKWLGFDVIRALLGVYLKLKRG